MLQGVSHVQAHVGALTRTSAHHNDMLEMVNVLGLFSHRTRKHVIIVCA